MLFPLLEGPGLLVVSGYPLTSGGGSDYLPLAMNYEQMPEKWQEWTAPDPA